MTADAESDFLEERERERERERGMGGVMAVDLQSARSLSDLSISFQRAEWAVCALVVGGVGSCSGWWWWWFMLMNGCIGLSERGRERRDELKSMCW